MTDISNNMQNDTCACWWIVYKDANFLDDTDYVADCISSDTSQTPPQASSKQVLDFSSDGDYATIGLDNEISSIITGPSCWLTLYHDSGCDSDDDQLNIGPNSVIPDLQQFQLKGGTSGTKAWDNRASSLTAYTSMPDGWAESTPAANKVGQRFAADQMEDSAAALCNTAVSTLLSAVPGGGVVTDVGSILTGLCSTLWPSGLNSTRLQDDAESWVMMQVKMMGITADLKTQETSIDSLHTALGYCVGTNNEVATDKLSDFLNDLDNAYAYVTAQTEPPVNTNWQAVLLHYMMITGILMAIVSRATLSVTFPDSDEGTTIQNAEDNLSTKLPNLISYMNQALDIIKTTRKNLMTAPVAPAIGDQGQGDQVYFWKDDYTGLLSLEQDDLSTAQADMAAYQDYTLTNNLTNDLDSIQEIIDALAYYTDTTSDTDQNNTGTQIPTITVKSQSGGYGSITSTTVASHTTVIDWSSVPGVSEIQIEEYRDKHDNITGLSISGGANANYTPLGSAGDITGDSSGTTSMSVAEQSVDRIVAVLNDNYDFGPVPSALHLVNSVNGETGVLQRLAGNNQNKAGIASATSAPDGAKNALLVGFVIHRTPGATDGDKNSVLTSIGCIWSFERLLPLGSTSGDNTFLTDLDRPNG